MKRRQKRSQDSAQHIESVARRLFADRGFAGTSIRDITSAADVNVGAVTYHFATKQDLYFGILRHCVGPVSEKVQAIAADPRSPMERIEALVRFFFDHVRRHPEMVPLMVRELASEHALAEPIRGMMQQAIPALARIIATGQREGTIRPGDPMLLALSSLAQPVYLNLARKGIAAAAGLDPNDPAIFDRVVDHCVITVRAALELRS